MVRIQICKFTRPCTALLGCLFLIVPDNAQAANIKARSVSFADVNAAVAARSPGDTVVVPAGTSGWTSTLYISKSITLLGAGNDATVILDDVPRNSAGQGSAIKVTLTATQSFRLSGFTFRYGSLTSKGINAIVGATTTTGPCRSFRVDHCHFDRLHQSNCLEITGWIYGVVDHFIFDGRIDGANQSVLVMHTTWGGGKNQFGDGSWADYPYYGTEKFIFIEDNVFNNPNPKNHT